MTIAGVRACQSAWTFSPCSVTEASRQAEKRAAAGQSGLPEMYRQVSMRALHSSRFDDFDFAAHNPTRFAGLENEIANCYANALLQVWPHGLETLMVRKPLWCGSPYVVEAHPQDSWVHESVSAVTAMPMPCCG